MQQIFFRRFSDFHALTVVNLTTTQVVELHYPTSLGGSECSGPFGVEARSSKQKGNQHHQPKRLPKGKKFRRSLKEFGDTFDELKLRPEHISVLQVTPFWHLFEAFITRRVQYRRKYNYATMLLVDDYNSMNQTFMIGDNELKITTSDASLIFGIINGERKMDLTYSRRVYSNFVTRRFPDKKELIVAKVKEALTAAISGQSRDDIRDVVRLLCVLLYSTFLIATGGNRVKWGFIRYIQDIEGMRQYDWCFSMLKEILNSISKSNNDVSKVTGCTTLLQVINCFAEYLMAQQLLANQSDPPPEQNNQYCVVHSLCLKWLDDGDEESLNKFAKPYITNFQGNYRYMIFPLLSQGLNKRGNHWTLVVFDTQLSRWDYYNSLRPRTANTKNHYLKGLRDMRSYVAVHYNGGGVGGNIDAAGQFIGMPIRNIRNSPQQTAGTVECGIILCDLMANLLFHNPMKSKCDTISIRAGPIHVLLNTPGRSWTRLEYEAFQQARELQFQTNE